MKVEDVIALSYEKQELTQKLERLKNLQGKHQNGIVKCDRVFFEGSSHGAAGIDMPAMTIELVDAGIRLVEHRLKEVEDLLCGASKALEPVVVTYS